MADLGLGLIGIELEVPAFDPDDDGMYIGVFMDADRATEFARLLVDAARTGTRDAGR